jgi:organic radical activating enzyme
MVYTAMATSPSGGLYSCCRMKMQERYWGDPNEYWNSDYIEKHKSLMNKGKWPAECIRCKQEEDIGHESKRIRENKNWQSLGYSLDDLESTNVVSRVDLRLSNVCNLMCVMCEPDSSSLIYNETEENLETTMKHYSDRYKSFKFDRKKPYTEDQIDNIIEMIQPSTSVYITGGEPSLLKPVYKLLERLIEKGFNNSVDLQFNSNFQSHNPKFIELINQFKKGLMMPSIDAVGDVAEYCRYPCNWNQVKSNLDNYLQSCPHWRTKIFVTPSILNIYKLESLFEFKESLLPNIKIKNLLSLSVENTLNWPEYFHLSLLPMHDRIGICDTIDKISQKYNILKSEQKDLYNLKNKLQKWDDNSHKLLEAFEQLDKIDNLRKTNWRKVLKDLAKLEERIKSRNTDIRF